MPRRCASPELIGRARELAELRLLLDAATGNESSLVLLGGEAGIGKSRLLEAFISEVTPAARVLVGRCVDLGDGALPFAPVADALRQLARELGPQGLPHLSGGSRRALARLVPQLSNERVDPVDPGEPGAQSALFAALLDAFDRLARDRPLAVAFEDLHWADRSTLALVDYLARSMGGTPVLLIGTFRTDELHRRHPLRPLLGELARLHTVSRIDLSPFGREDVAAQVRAIAGEELDDLAVGQIHGRSDGNPFFVEELVAEHRARGAAQLPTSLRDVLLSALGSLPAETRRILDGAAAVGRSVDHRLLEAVTGVRGRELSDLLRPAVEHQLLVEAADGRYRFRHALTLEAVYDELLSPERAALHRSIAEALEAHPELAEGGPRNADAELAHHWYAGHALCPAFAASLAAAERAMGMAAYADALRHYDRALSLWTERDPHAETPTEAAVLAAAADAAHRAGDYRREAAHLRAALANAADCEVEPEAELRRRLSIALGRGGDGETALREAERLRDLVAGAPESAERARALATWAGVVFLQRGAEHAVAPAQTALEAARAVGARIPEAQALRVLGDGLRARGDVEEGLTRLEEALDIATETTDIELAAVTYNNVLLALISTQRYDRADSLVERVLGWLDAGAERHAASVHITTKVAWRLLAAGRWDEAQVLLDRVARHPTTGVDRIVLHEIQALLRLYQGRVNAAAAELDEARAAGAHDDRQLRRPWFTLEALRAALDGHVQDAREASDAALASEAVWEIDVWAPIHLVRAEVDAALAASPADRPAHRARACDVVAALASHVGDPDALIRPWPIAHDVARAEAELTRVTGPDPARWRALLTDETHAFWRLDGRLRLAEALLATGERDEAAGELRAVHADAVALDAGIVRADAESLARRAGMRLDGVDLTEPDDLGLTRREREVLRLIAEGRTNREIGERLYITSKTASVHVSNILGKLGVANRIEAAKAAQRPGLIDLTAAGEPERHAIPASKK